MKQFKPFLCLTIFLIFCSSAWADIPKQINFQGVLRDSVGNPYPDGNYSLTFRIYNAASGGSIFWQEVQTVSLSGGLFSTLLGSVTPIPESAFTDSLRWLGVQVASNPEITPRRQLVSTPFAYVADFAQNAGKLGGSDESNFVRRTGPDSVVSTSGTAFLGKVSGSGGVLYGIRGSAQNISTETAYGGFFSTSSSGTGNHYGVLGESFGSSSAPTYGSSGVARNTSGGPAYGGYFFTSSSGTGTHYGVRGEGFGSSSAYTYGFYGLAQNTSTGPAYGGFFTTFSGTGTHYGVYGEGSGSSSATAYGCYGSADNTSTGLAFGGYFITFSSGTGTHVGVEGLGYGSSSAATYGFSGFADNTSTGTAYGGRFDVTSSGTGTHFGVYGQELAGGSGAAVYAAGDFAASGTKSAVLKTSQGERLFYTVESPEVWFEDFGEGELVNGKAHIELDALFLETVTINSLHPMKVFIQLKDDCKGVYVKTQTTGFDVFELQSGLSNASFSYRIVAKRKGYENQRLLQTTLGMDDPNLYPELWQEIEKRHQETKIDGNLENKE